MSMTVGELKEQLASLDDSLLVVLASDAEGNAFELLESISLGDHEPYLGISRAPDDPNEETDDWDPEENEINAVVLWPEG